MDLPQRRWVDEVFTIVTRNRPFAIRAFKIFYLILITILFFGGWSIYQGDTHAISWYRLAPWMGRAGIIAYILTTIPGITRRFRIQHKLVGLLMIYRREVGITMYLFITVHYFFLIGIATWFRKILIIPQPLFQVAGLTAYVLTFFLFATSNDFSVRTLGPWWHRIHRLTYVIIWFIVLHVALQRLSIWSVLIGLTALAQGASWIAVYERK